MSLQVPAGMQTIMRAALVLSPSSPQRVVIADELDGDMTFVFKLCTDASNPTSYTRLDIHDDHNAEIQIFNANPQLVAKPAELIRTGIYRRDFALYTTFELKREGIDGTRICIVEFYIERIDHGTEN